MDDKEVTEHDEWLDLGNKREWGICEDPQESSLEDWAIDQVFYWE